MALPKFVRRSRRRLRLSTFALLFGSVLASPAGVALAQETQVIDWRFAKGRYVTYRNRGALKMQRTLASKPAGDLEYDVDERSYHLTRCLNAEGLAEMESGTLRLKVTARYGKSSVTWDSADERLRKARSLPSMRPWVEGVDRKYVFTMDVPGRDVRTIHVAPANGAKTAVQPRDLEQQRQSFEAGRRLFPREPVAVGEAWERRSTRLLYLGHLLVLRRTYTLTGFQDYHGRRCAHLEVVSRGTLEPEVEGQPLTYHLVESRGTETLLFELERGLIVHSEKASSLKVSRTVHTVDRGDLEEVETRSSKFTLEALNVEVLDPADPRMKDE